MKNPFAILLASLFGLAVFTGYSQGASRKSTEIILLHTNDMHARIDNMAKLAYLADSLRKSHPDVFLVSAGDNFTGNPVVDMAPDKGFPMIDLMNRCGFNVSAMGNHEFDMGQEFLRKRLSQAAFPFICSNFDASGATLGAVKPYVVLGTSTGDSIVLLGLIQLDDNGLPSSIPTHLTGIRFEKGWIKARKYTWLKERYGNLIALSHLGLEDDIVLADSVPQFDLVIGGHSHTLLDKPRMENGVMIVQAGSYLKYVGKTTLQVDHGHITGRTDEVIPMASLNRETPGVKSLVSQYNSNPDFDKVIAVAEKPIEGVDELGSMMTDAITHKVKVDFAFQNKGGIRIPSLAAGNITLRDIYKLDPFSNQVVLFSMKPAEIRSLLCYGFQHEKQADLQVSGMTYTIITDGHLHCVSVELYDKTGKPLNPATEYSVAVNSYIASAYIFDHRDKGTTMTFTTTEALIGYLTDMKTVSYSGVKRVSVDLSH